MEQDAPLEAPRSTERPLGVKIITIYVGIMAGLIPLVASLALFFGGGFGTPVEIALSVLLASGIIASAIGAWRGSARARDVLVVLAVIHYAALAYKNGSMVLDGTSPVRDTIAWGRVFRSLVQAAIVVWYFRFSWRRPDEFYGRVPEPQP